MEKCVVNTQYRTEQKCRHKQLTTTNKQQHNDDNKQQHNDEHNKQNKHPNGISRGRGGREGAEQQHQHQHQHCQHQEQHQEQKQEQHQSSTRSSTRSSSRSNKTEPTISTIPDLAGLKPAVEGEGRDSKGVDGVEYKHRINMDRKNYHLVLNDHHQDNQYNQ
jgi:hypothetical protein